MFAASHGQSKLVRLLVEDGRANLNIADNVSFFKIAKVLLVYSNKDV